MKNEKILKFEKVLKFEKEVGHDMNVKIYDERTGQLIFPIVPGKDPQKDENVVELFNNRIDLYVEKKIKELRISCHVVVQQGIVQQDTGESREDSRGYYIKSLSKFEDDSFTEFKKESSKALHTLGISRNIDDINNVVLDNIEKLDMDIYLHEDTDIIAHVLESGEYLEYQAGNIDEITIFCKDILKRIDSSKIAISYEACKLGDINILRTRRQEEPLRANERTKAILDKHRKELIEKKRKEDEIRAKEKINNGTNLIKEGLTILRSSGHEPKDISDEIDKIYDEISASNKIRLKDRKPKEKERGSGRKNGSVLSGIGSSIGSSTGIGSSTDNVERPQLNRTAIIIIVVVGALIIYSIIWGSPFEGIGKLLGGGGGSNTVKSTPVPVVTLPPIKNLFNNNFDMVVNIINGFDDMTINIVNVFDDMTINIVNVFDDMTINIVNGLDDMTINIVNGLDDMTISIFGGGKL